MVAEGGGGRGGTGTELGWTGECDGDGGGGRQSCRHMRGSTCTAWSLGDSVGHEPAMLESGSSMTE